MSKSIAFNVDYSRSNLASTIIWTDPKHKIKDCEATIDLSVVMTEMTISF
jgi:hypothetical protein